MTERKESVKAARSLKNEKVDSVISSYRVRQKVNPPLAG